MFHRLTISLLLFLLLPHLISARPRTSRLSSLPSEQRITTHILQHDSFDVIVVGAGYSGLVAARKLARREMLLQPL